MEELLQMCTFPKRSALYHYIIIIMGHAEFSKSMTMIILYHHHHYNAQGGDAEVHIRQKMGGGNEVNFMIINNLTSKSMVTDKKVPCLTKCRSVTLGKL